MVLGISNYVPFRRRVQTPNEAGQQRQRQLHHGLPATSVYSAGEAGFPGRILVPSHHRHAGSQYHRSLYKTAQHVRDIGERARAGPQRALHRDIRTVWADPGRLKSRWTGEEVAIISNTFPKPWGQRRRRIGETHRQGDGSLEQQLRLQPSYIFSNGNYL